MAYTINSAKDSQGNEDQFVAMANANAQKIYDYKAQHGGDFEHAFQAVTGIPWPEGRSLKMHNYQAEMTKDRTVKSVLGKYVAPIAAGVAAPFILPALAGGGAAAGGAAAGGGGAAAGGAGTAAATAAAAGTGGSLLHALLPTLISSGATLAGTAIASHANSAAAKTAAEQADKALDLTKEQYALQRQDTAPYRALGQGAVRNLAYLSGLNIDSQVPELSSTVPKVPYGQPAPTLSTLGQPDAEPAQPLSELPGLVPMRTPDGRVLGIPQEHVSEAQQHGAQFVNA